VRGSRIHTILLVIGILCATVCRAGNTYTEVIQTLCTTGKMVLSAENTIGKTDSVTYTCSGGASIGMDVIRPIGQKVIAINLPGKDDQVVTSELEDLTKLRFYYYDFTSDLQKKVVDTSIRVYVSEDGESWGSALTDEVSLSGKTIIVDLPKGTRRVKLQNVVSTRPFSIWQIDYTFEHCNCFRYESGE